MSGQRYAVLVGVSNYEKLTKLECGGDDAAAVRDALITAEFDYNNVYLLADPGQDSKDPEADRHEGAQGRPTKEDIDEVLEDLANKKLDPDDTILFFFSGHGIRHEGDYLVPRAASTKIIAKSCLKITDIVKTLRKSGSRQIVMLLDACRDELKPKSIGVGLEVQEYISNLKDDKQGVGILFSCLQEAKSYIVEDEGRYWSAFTKGLVDAIDSPDHVTLTHVEGFLASFLQSYNLAHQVPVQKPYLTQNPHSIANLPLFGSPTKATAIGAGIGEELLRLEMEEGLEIVDQLIDFVNSPEWHNDEDPLAVAKQRRILRLTQGRYNVENFMSSWTNLKKIEARKKADTEGALIAGPRAAKQDGEDGA
jgi:uncharacterized caspase-like protein